ncbi:MAG: RNA-processing protein [Candidatus Heimdallarchaeota archaeon]|nr:RNA-processing protein [Candidatus Heimdallarchaeota archaeon]MCK5048800.1 RNA-processing protein [Candidatus Heimdallarchaeota archaeon]
MKISDEIIPPQSEILRIPKNRIGVVIGVGGTIRRQLEESTKTRIIVDSETGEVEIYATENTTDPLQIWVARDIVKAIGRGFSPDRANKLLDDSYYLEIISLIDLIPDRMNVLKRVKSRIIGKNGRTRELIEEYTRCHISISGKTISILGKYIPLGIAKEALLRLVQGERHTNIYRFLESSRRELEQTDIQVWRKRTAPPDLGDSDDIFHDEEMEDLLGMGKITPDKPKTIHEEE